jgi:hypothetical protein
MLAAKLQAPPKFASELAGRVGLVVMVDEGERVGEDWLVLLQVTDEKMHNTVFLWMKLKLLRPIPTHVRPPSLVHFPSDDDDGATGIGFFTIPRSTHLDVVLAQLSKASVSILSATARRILQALLLSSVCQPDVSATLGMLPMELSLRQVVDLVPTLADDGAALKALIRDPVLDQRFLEHCHLREDGGMPGLRGRLLFHLSSTVHAALSVQPDAKLTLELRKVVESSATALDHYLASIATPPEVVSVTQHVTVTLASGGDEAVQEVAVLSCSPAELEADLGMSWQINFYANPELTILSHTFALIGTLHLPWTSGKPRRDANVKCPTSSLSIPNFTVPRPAFVVASVCHRGNKSGPRKSDVTCQLITMPHCGKAFETLDFVTELIIASRRRCDDGRLPTSAAMRDNLHLLLIKVRSSFMMYIRVSSNVNLFTVK